MLYSVLLVVCYVLFESLSKLVWARCLLWTAFDAVKSCDCVADFHPFDKCANTFQVAVATTKERNVANFAIYHVERDFA